jgi:putative membrane protein
VKSKKRSHYTVAIYEIGHAICRVHRNSRPLRMSRGGILDWRRMITEHTQMTASMKPFVDAWGLTPPTGPDADHQKELDELSGLSGIDFDKAYMKDMVSDHSKALNAFTKEAKDTKDANFRVAVVKGKTAVAAHKNMAYDLEKKL